jgi:hypothetical protein
MELNFKGCLQMDEKKNVSLKDLLFVGKKKNKALCKDHGYSKPTCQGKVQKVA